MPHLTDISAPGQKIEGELLYSMQQEVARLLGTQNKRSFPGAQPVSFARRHLEELTRVDYFCCEKSDGMRYLLYLTEGDQGNEIHYLIDRRNDYWYIPPMSLHLPTEQDVAGFHTGTVIDGELVLDKVAGSSQLIPKFLVFDCLALDGASITNRPLDKRIAHFKEKIFRPYKKLFDQFPQEKEHQQFFIELKQMQLGYAAELMFNQILPNLPHGNDGLIFTCRPTGYTHGTDHNILKWKPEDENSIDFRLCLEFPLLHPDETDRAEGITEPYLDYDATPVFNLHVNAGDKIEDPWYGTMYVEPREWEELKARQQPLNDRVVECYMDARKQWRFMRFRDDKENANHMSTVESVIESIQDRVTKEDLIAAVPAIRTEWKIRNSQPAPLEAGAVAGVKRKADE